MLALGPCGPVGPFTIRLTCGFIILLPQIRHGAHGHFRTMKTLFRILVLVLIGCVIYFATIGRNDFYRLLDAVSEIIQAIGNNYLKK